MAALLDTPERYGRVTRFLHWGIAILFAAQFLSAAAHWALPREHGFREAVWSYHSQLGTTLFLLVLIRGAWALFNLRNRPPHLGMIGRVARAGHLAIYMLMVVVPLVRLVAAAGGKRDFVYLGVTVFEANETEIVWMRAAAELHGEMGWLLAFLVVGHIAMAVGWHRIVKRDGTLARMIG